MNLKQKFDFVIRYFEVHMPQPETELTYRTPFELVVSVILSAQCTDKRVNQATPALFHRYPSPESMAAASQEEIFEYIRSCSYPNNKARNLQAMAQMLLQRFGGEVPSEVEQLTQLPGVGRKTANVVASVIFNQPAMAVDTHVFRVSARIGLTRNAKTPLAAEKQLVRYFPSALLPKAHHWLILHGRYVCQARKPKCQTCGLSQVCNYFKTNQSAEEFLVKKTENRIHRE